MLVVDGFLQSFKKVLSAIDRRRESRGSLDGLGGSPTWSSVLLQLHVGVQSAWSHPL